MSVNRFIEAQTINYDQALKEIKNGRKITHWMWYIFPQIDGLGYSSTAKYYAIKDSSETLEYINNDILGNRLREITNCLLNLNTNDSVYIFGEIDSNKLKSCMTLFYLVTKEQLFMDVLKKYYNGTLDNKTINILNNEPKVYSYHIYESVYNDIKNGIKTIEFRLLNDKSKNIKLGDIINFTVVDNDSLSIKVSVIDKLIYNNIDELWEDKEILKNNILDMNKEEFIQKFNNSAIVGIKIRLID